MSKREIEDFDENELSRARKQAKAGYVKKHTLDTDEEDSEVEEERYNVMHENDIEGEEDGVPKVDGEVKITPFNMKEELEEGHFDGDGHFQWNKSRPIADNWLDNLDWYKIKETGQLVQKPTGSGDESSDSDTEAIDKKFDLIGTYKRILELMKSGETIRKTLQRYGKLTEKISSAERWRRKKAGIVDENSQIVTELTELANNILTQTGNMDVYDETFEDIAGKYGKTIKVELDMYADDFDTKEKTKLNDNVDVEEKKDTVPINPSVQWEFKWKQEDQDVHGPFSTEKMQSWVEEGYFKDGVYVKKHGTDGQYSTSNRIDFELYL